MFPSALAAAQAAVAIQQELAAQDVSVRVGIHVGEVIVEPERLTGDAVNIAARIESFACPAAVMLSDDAYAQLRNRSDISVVPLGEFRLKNVGRPFELYAVAAEGLVVPDPETLEGKGERLALLPTNLPVSATPLVGRAADLAVPRRARPGSPRRHDHRPGRRRQDPRARRARAAARSGVPRRRRVRDGRRRDRRGGLRSRARRGARREGGRGAHAGRGNRGADREQDGAPAPRQPGADRRRGRDGGGSPGRFLPRAADRGDEQDAAEDRRGAGLRARAARARLRGVALRRACPRARAHGRERSGRLRDLPAPRRATARARARRGEAPAPDSGRAARAARARSRPARLGLARRAGAAADAARDDRVEPLAAGRAGAAAVPAAGGVRRRLHVRGRRSRVRGSRNELPRRARVAGRQGARPVRRPGWAAADAGDDPGVRRRAARRRRGAG